MPRGIAAINRLWDELKAAQRAEEEASLAQPTMPSAPPVEHTDSAKYWGAASSASGASEPLPGSYLSPVPRAPNWEQVVPSATPWSPWPRLPSPTSWGSADPGIECRRSGGHTTCITPGGRQTTVPVSPDFAGYMGPGERNYHYYSKPVAAEGLDPSMLMQGVIDSPTPGPSYLVRPATREGTTNEATPGYLYNPYLGLTQLAPGTPAAPILSYLTADQNGTPMVVNVTQPGHPLHPGVVIRYVTPSPSGATIQNEGTGLGWLQAPGRWSAEKINSVWNDQSRAIMERLSRRVGRPRGETRNPLGKR